MKRLALVLGSLLVVGSVASAKEVMPAPTPAPEKVVEYVEKPVIVYRDREVTPAWRPNGSVDVQYRWYGETENKTKKDPAAGTWINPDNNNAGRLQTETKINFTKNQSLEVRTRNYHTLRSTDKGDSNADSDQVRIRHFYKFGKLGSSKIDATSRLEYKQSKGDAGKKHVEASVFFDFADYIYSNNFFKVDKFGLRTGYEHNWAGHDSGVNGQEFSKGTNNRAILNFESEYTLPWGFSAELNVYNGYDWHNKKFAVIGKDDKKNQYYGSMEAYIYQHTPLYKNNAVELSFNFEGGYDPYAWHQYKIIDNGGKGDRNSYQVYMLPTFQVAYKPTEFVKLYAAAGAEYRNWAVDAQSKAKNWRWQPTAWAGMKVTF